MLVEIVVFRTGRSVVRVEQEQEKALKIFQTFSVMFKDLNQRLVFLRPNLMNKKRSLNYLPLLIHGFKVKDS